MLARGTKKRLLSFYESAARDVADAGYGWEAEWQRKRLGQSFGEQDLLREAAWVILCSGFRETSVRNKFGYISLCFCDWHSAIEITENRRECIETAFCAFRHIPKLRAIASVAESICSLGFNELRARIQKNPISELRQFSFIGATTSWHLAKNLGLNVAKNDRHLARTAAFFGYTDAHDICGLLSAETGEPAAVIDIVLWRYATLALVARTSEAPQPSFQVSYASPR